MKKSDVKMGAILRVTAGELEGAAGEVREIGTKAAALFVSGIVKEQPVQGEFEVEFEALEFQR